MKQRISVPSIHRPTTYYSHAIVVDGWVYTAGQAPHRPDGSVWEPSDPEGQIRQVWENMREVLEAAGSNPENILRLVVLLKDRDLVPLFWKVSSDYLGTCRPATSLAVVKGMADTRYLIEMEAIALCR